MTDKELILTKEEAEHIALAITSLNIVNAKVYVKFYDSEKTDWRGVVEHRNGKITVSKVVDYAVVQPMEHYASQLEFFEAYEV